MNGLYFSNKPKACALQAKFSSVACLKIHTANPHLPFKTFRNFASVVQIEQKHWQTYLALCVLPRSIYGINWENFHAQPSLDSKHYNMQALAVTNLKSRVVQFIGYYFEVQTRILQPEKTRKQSALNITIFSTVL